MPEIIKDVVIYGGVTIFGIVAILGLLSFFIPTERCPGCGRWLFQWNSGDYWDQHFPDNNRDDSRSYCNEAAYFRGYPQSSLSPFASILTFPYYGLKYRLRGNSVGAHLYPLSTAP